MNREANTLRRTHAGSSSFVARSSEIRVDLSGFEERVPQGGEIHSIGLPQLDGTVREPW